MIWLHVHNSWIGHRGVEARLQATCRLLKDEGAAGEECRDVSKFIRQCPICQKSSVSKVAYNTIPFTTLTEKPHDRINQCGFIPSVVSTNDSKG
jgi:hypothetical protein